MTIENLQFSSDGKNLQFKIVTGSASITLNSLAIKKYDSPEYTDISDYESTVRTYDDRKEYIFDIFLEGIGIEEQMNMLYLHAEDSSSNIVESGCSYLADVYFCLYQTIIGLTEDKISTPDYLLMNRLYMLKYAHEEAMSLGREEEAELLYERITEVVSNWPNKYLALDPYPTIND